MRIRSDTKILGLFAHPIEHSLSPAMHNAAIAELDMNYIYVPFHVLPKDIAGAVDSIKALNITGVNVTIPHKESIINFLDNLTDNAKRLGSVNTIVNKDGYLIGDSTDGPGFLKSLKEDLGDISNSKVLVLGAGGSAKAICFSLVDLGCEVVIANRTLEKAVNLSREINDVCGIDITRACILDETALENEVVNTKLLVNTTSVGMFPNVNEMPLSANLLHDGMWVYDLIYNPYETTLIAEAKAKGAKTASGLNMLVYQGAISFEMWTGKYPPVDIMKNTVAKALNLKC